MSAQGLALVPRQRLNAVRSRVGDQSVTDPIALLGALADVLAPGGEIVLETYGSRLAADAPAIEVHVPGDVYARDDFVYWGFTSRV